MSRAVARGRMRLLRALAALAGVAVACGGGPTEPAAASTVSVRSTPTGAGIEYRAATGEVNRIEITRLNDHAIRVSDVGAVIAAGEQCEALDAHTAVCRTAEGQPTLFDADVQAGDMDDLVSGRLRHMSADGGPGDDRLVMSSGYAALNGGGGRDALVGGPGGDTFVDGDTSAAYDADLLDGGDGPDWVSYKARTRPVRVDLADAAPDGEAGEGDVILSIESGEGGAGADHLAGQSGASRLVGHGGADRLEGRKGRDIVTGGSGDDRLAGGRDADVLEGGSGADRFSGGAGNDAHYDGEGAHDRHDCGTGSDYIGGPRRHDVLGSSCESAQLHFGRGVISVDPYPGWRDAGTLTFGLTCPMFQRADDSVTRAVTGSITLRESSERRRLLGAGTISEPAGDRCAESPPPRRLSVQVLLTSLGRRAAMRGRGVRATISLRGRNLPRTAWTIRLRRGAS